MLARVGTLCILLVLLGLPCPAATFSVQGSNLTVTSNNLQVTFRGPDVIAITNLLTNESYLRSPASNLQMYMNMVTPPSQGLTAGTWTLDAGQTTATLAVSDSTRTITLHVSVDSTTQELVVNVGAQSTQAGIEQLGWVVTGFDMNSGQFYVPGAGGVSLNSASFRARSFWNFSYVNSGSHWEAPLSIYQSTLGGVAMYSTDTNYLFKGLNFVTNANQTVNQQLYVEAPAPWNSATTAGPLQWRFAAYTGTWQDGARIYRDWHENTYPPIALTGARAWAANIRTVIEFGWGPPYDNSVADTLATVLDPTKTLLYMVNWRTNYYDVGYPDYTPTATLASFVAHAHQLGFRVMLHTDIIGVSPNSADYATVQQYQVKDPLSLALYGWNWNQPVSTPNRYAQISLASSTWRSLFVQRLTPAVEAINPDALHLDYTFPVNDGNGLIDGLNYNQGEVQMVKDLETAFPSLVFGTEGNGDTFAPYTSFAQQMTWAASGNGYTPDNANPVPVSAYVLPHNLLYFHLGTLNPYEGGFVSFLQQYEKQAVLPTYHSPNYPGDGPNYSNPDMARYMKVVTAFQKDNLSPAWDQKWNTSTVLYSGSNSSSASLADNGSLVSFTLQDQGTSPSVLYQRVHDANQVTSSSSVPNWPAWNGPITMGLDPAYQFWLDPIPPSAAQPHISSLPAGVKLGLGAGSLVTSDFAYFRLDPPDQPPFDFFGGLWGAHVGTTFQGVDSDLQNGAVVYLTTMVVGGVSRQGIFAHPPFQGIEGLQGGETFIEYTVPVPKSNSVSFQFAPGILDGVNGLRVGPMTFKVEVNGSLQWSQDVSTGAWQPGSIDLAAFAGQTITIRLISNPGPANNSSYAWGGWSALQLVLGQSQPVADFAVTLPNGVTPVSVFSPSPFTLASGQLNFSRFPLGSTAVLLLTTPQKFGVGQSLLNLPFADSQSSDGELAGPNTTTYNGVVTSFNSGGVFYNALFQAPPLDGQTVFSWPLQLPHAANLTLTFAAGLRSDDAPWRDVSLYARINGVVQWQYTTRSIGWQYKTLDLSPWSGQDILFEVITDSGGSNGADWTGWADLTLHGSLLPSVYIDNPVPNAVLTQIVPINGWAIENIDGVGSNAISSLAVLVDGTQVGTAVYGSLRSGVCVAYPGRPGCPNVGWTYNLDVTSLAPGSHTLTVVATDSANFTGSAQRTFTVPATFAPASLTFPNQIVTSHTAPRSIVITNTYAFPLQIAGITATGSDFHVNNNCPSTLALGASCTITAAFVPTTTGAKQGSISITDNAPGSPHILPLSGTGYDVTAVLQRPSRPTRSSQSASAVLSPHPLHSPQSVAPSIGAPKIHHPSRHPVSPPRLRPYRQPKTDNRLPTEN